MCVSVMVLYRGRVDRYMLRQCGGGVVERDVQERRNYLHVWKNVEYVRQVSFEFAEVYYNRQRIQKGLGYLTFSEYELGIDMRMV